MNDLSDPKFTPSVFIPYLWQFDFGSFLEGAAYENCFILAHGFTDLLVLTGYWSLEH